MTSTSPNTLPTRPLALVESDGDDVAMMQLLLRKAGADHPVELYHRADELIATFSKLLKKSAAFLPLLCFLELSLPDMSGLDVLKWIRSQPALDEMSVVVLSASESPQQIRQASAAGAQCYLAKYPQPSTLKRTIAEASSLAAAGNPAQHWFGIRENLILRWLPSAETIPT